ncbi:MAG: hypothetical protein KGN16_20720 [Burkholderiales bacterium]|nr:hypothetical protein [Burkholderiales bacterium]
MDQAGHFAKTPAGVEEVRARSLKLPPRLRTMLVMIDGSTPTARLREAAATLGAPADFLQTLQDHGLIEWRAAPGPVTAPQALYAAPSAATPAASAPRAPSSDEGARFLAAQKFMNESAVDALGLRAFFFTLKLERCYVLGDLRALLPEFAKAVTRGAGAEVARVVEARARELIG